MGIDPLDDLMTAGQENHDGVMMLFHEIGRKILAGRAGRKKNTSGQAPTRVVSTRS